MQNKTLSDWLSYIESFPLQPARLNLSQLQSIAERLNIYPIHHPIITVTGTNGKGSCVALLTAILRNNGYKIATYSSPHLLNYRERIICDNKPVTDEQLCAAFSLIEQHSQKIILNYFEWTTLAAFIIFKQTSLDAWILEVGLGGRLDPVNILDADLAIISSIALDHTNILGNSLEKIGFEKSGIMRTGKPTICGDFQTPSSIKQYATKISANLFCQNEHFAYSVNGNTWCWWNNYKTRQTLPLPHLELQNAATVLAAVEQLSSHFNISDESIHDALIYTKLSGRYQKIDGAITQILDVAHNPSATKLLAKKLLQEKSCRCIHAVFAMLNDKDHQGTIKPLIPLIQDYMLPVAVLHNNWLRL
jgi:dihydrofolate synthase/folylpolyglutamate synthase